MAVPLTGSSHGGSPPRTDSESASVRQVEVRRGHWRKQGCPRRTSVEFAVLRFCPADCPPNNVRRGHYRTLADTKLSVSDIMWRTDRRTESESCDVRRGQLCIRSGLRLGGHRLGGHWRTPNPPAAGQMSAVGTAGI